MVRHKLPTTLADVRAQVRKGQYDGDLFDALKFVLGEYDTLWSVCKKLTNPTEYIITKDDKEHFDVV